MLSLFTLISYIFSFVRLYVSAPFVFNVLELETQLLSDKHWNPEHM